MLQWQLLGVFQHSSETSLISPESHKKLRLPRSHYIVKSLVCEKLTTQQAHFNIANTLTKKKQSCENVWHSNLTCDFLLPQKQTWLPVELNMHACYVIADIAVPLKNHGVIFLFLLLSRWTKTYFDSRIPMCGEICTSLQHVFIYKGYIYAATALQYP